MQRGRGGAPLHLRGAGRAEQPDGQRPAAGRGEQGRPGDADAQTAPRILDHHPGPAQAGGRGRARHPHAHRQRHRLSGAGGLHQSGGLHPGGGAGRLRRRGAEGLPDPDDPLHRPAAKGGLPLPGRGGTGRLPRPRADGHPGHRPHDHVFHLRHHRLSQGRDPRLHLCPGPHRHGRPLAERQGGRAAPDGGGHRLGQGLLGQVYGQWLAGRAG